MSIRGDRRGQLLSLVVIVVGAVIFGVVVYKALGVVQKRQITTNDGIYTNRVTTSEEIATLAAKLVKGCDQRVCEVQKLLDFVTNIPYKSEYFQANSPKKTVELNLGDCDDKSNLFISLLHSLGIEGYLVLVPKHIFVIVPLDRRDLPNKKALWLDGEPHYILESTAKDSSIGFPLRYSLEQIDTILDPFGNKKQIYHKIEYR